MVYAVYWKMNLQLYWWHIIECCYHHIQYKWNTHVLITTLISISMRYVFNNKRKKQYLDLFQLSPNVSVCVFVLSSTYKFWKKNDFFVLLQQISNILFGNSSYVCKHLHMVMNYVFHLSGVVVWSRALPHMWI